MTYIRFLRLIIQTVILVDGGHLEEFSYQKPYTLKLGKVVGATSIVQSTSVYPPHIMNIFLRGWLVCCKTDMIHVAKGILRVS